MSPKALILLAVVLAVLSLSSCSLILTRPAEPVLEHTVRFKGESIPLISSWYTGTEKNAKALKNFNDLKSSTLKVGQELWIPKRLLIRNAILPKSYLVSAQRKKNFRNSLVRGQPKIDSPIAPKKSPLDLAQASRSSNVGKNISFSKDAARQSKPNDWIREELERDLIQESILAKKLSN